MKLRSKPDDLAMVVSDTPACTSNVGRTVRICGPLQYNKGYDEHCWLIEPTSRTPYAVERGASRLQLLYFENLIDHPDQWPIESMLMQRSSKVGAA